MCHLIFDFDGVLVDSVNIKTNAFCELFSEYNNSIVNQIKSYHLANGGISRFEKIRYFYKNFIKEELDQDLFKLKCSQFKRLVIKKVIASNEICGAHKLISTKTKGYKFIVTGTPQEEIEEILIKKNWLGYFDEVLGSPIKKNIHVRYLLEKYKINSQKCLFFGDASTDYEAAKLNNVPFLGVCNKQSELYSKHPEIDYIENFSNFNLNSFKKEKNYVN